MNKYTDVPSSTVPRDTRTLDERTGNLYETVVILSKRANQIAAQMKDELHGKLEEFTTDNDNLEEVFENREQIEISKYYESLPKPTLMATEEFLQGKVYFRNPSKDAPQ
jgi:DNA-directed RNA polymerase subunit K/omega